MSHEKIMVYVTRDPRWLWSKLQSKAKFMVSKSVICIFSYCTFDTLLKAAHTVPSVSTVGSSNSSDTHHPVFLH